MSNPRYYYRNDTNEVICLIDPKIDPPTCVNASVRDGEIERISIFHPQEGDDIVSRFARFDFHASADTWREIVRQLAPRLGVKLAGECPGAKVEVSYNAGKIIELHKAGTSQADIARRLGLNRSTVCRALKKVVA